MAPLVKLVIFLVVTSLATYVLAATINNSAFGATTSYKAQFTDVTGLEIGDDVRIAGVRVGTVSGIKSVHENGKHSYALVSFTVQKSRPLPTSVQAVVRYRNLVGQRYVDIEQCADNGTQQCTGAPGATLNAGATIPLRQTAPAVDLTVLFEGFRPLTEGLAADEINKLSYQIIQSLQGESGSFESLLSTIADLTNTLADKDKVIGEVIDNLTGVLTAVGQHDNQLSDLIIQLRRFVSGLAQDRTTIGNSIDGVNQLATSTAGLLTQVRPPLAKDIQSVSRLAGTLNDNSDTIKYVINELPPTVAGLIRTGSYGSWFNFYLCTVSGIISYPGGGKKQFTFSEGSQARCKS